MAAALSPPQIADDIPVIQRAFLYLMVNCTEQLMAGQTACLARINQQPVFRLKHKNRMSNQ